MNEEGIKLEQINTVSRKALETIVREIEKSKIDNTLVVLNILASIIHNVLVNLHRAGAFNDITIAADDVLILVHKMIDEGYEGANTFPLRVN